MLSEGKHTHTHKITNTLWSGTKLKKKKIPVFLNFIFSLKRFNFSEYEKLCRSQFYSQNVNSNSVYLDLEFRHVCTCQVDCS